MALPSEIETAPAELADILAAYTAVTERLQASHDRLAGEVSRLRGELASKNRELERRSRLAALGQMAAGMAHEIRNPLGGIALYASLLARQLVDQPQPRLLAERIATGVQRLDVIVNDILAFAGEIHPQKRSVALAAILKEAHEMAAGRLERSGTSLIIETADELEVKADPVLLVRAISNVLFNAVDAAPGGQVKMAVRAKGDSVVITVADNGPGIAPEAVERLFNPFFTTRDTGTGLGLAIVHRILEGHGGRIAAVNALQPEGLGGALFTLTLPRE